MDTKRWKEHRDDHINRLAEDISTAEGYVKEYSDYSTNPSDDDNSEDLGDALEEMTTNGYDGLNGFCRVYPRENQDVMIVLTNPKFKIKEEEDFEKSDNYLLSKTEDIEERVQLCMPNSYLLDDDGMATTTRRALAKLIKYSEKSDLVQIPILDNQEELSQDDLEEELKKRGHEYIYYTNYYKFATKDSSYIPDWAKDEDIVSDFLEEEIQSINPSTIIVFGKKTWEDGFRHQVETTELAEQELDEPLDSCEISDVAGLPLKFQHSNTMIIPLKHPQALAYDNCKKVAEA